MEISKLGEKIKEYRTKKNISMYQLSKLANVGASTIYEIESGIRQSITTINLEKISKCLNVSVEELLGLDNKVFHIETDIEKQFEITLSNKILKLGNEPLTLAEKDYIKEYFYNTINELLFIKKLFKIYNIDITKFNTADEILQEKEKLMNKIKENSYK